MKLSPVQLIHLTFRKVLVEIDANIPFDVAQLSQLNAFNFDGVTLHTRIHVEEVPEAAQVGESGKVFGQVFQIAVDLLVDNQASKGGRASAPSPYLLDLQAAALVRISPGITGPNSPRDLAAVNGAALVWAALREQLSSITARMARGPALLPSVHFMDLRESRPDAQMPASQAPATGRRPRSKKTVKAD